MQRSRARCGELAVFSNTLGGETFFNTGLFLVKVQRERFGWSNESLQNLPKTCGLLLLCLAAGLTLANSGGEHPDGMTALHLAAKQGDIEEVKRLLDQGAALETRDKAGSTPLHWAVYTGRYEIVKFLIAEGADVNAEDGWHSTPLLRATEWGHKDVVQLVIAKGANVKVGNKLGETPLHAAAARGYKDIAQVLIANGADVNANLNEGGTPLHAAVARGHKDMVELLIAARADVNANLNQGGTPLHSLAFYVRPENRAIAKLLIAKGADVNQAEGMRGMTALHLAIEHSNEDIFEVLVASGANVNATDNNGSTPLHYAARYKGFMIPEEMATEMAREIIAKGADLEVKDKWGNTPLISAIKMGGESVAELLVENGAKCEDIELLLILLKSPQEFDKLSAQEKTRLLSTAAETSYRILQTRVSKLGLRESQKSVGAVTNCRRWLERTRDVTATILAFRLQHAVDSCLLNEMYRYEQHRQGRPRRVSYVEGSIDEELVWAALKANGVSPVSDIALALSVNTEIGAFCRQNEYESADFLTGRIFKEAPEHLKVPIEIVTEENRKERRRTEQISIRHWLSRTPAALISTKRDAARFLLPMTLRAIDDAINARLLASIFTEHGGFADKLEGDEPIAESKSFDKRIREALSKETVERLTFQRADSGDRIVSDIKNRLREYTEQESQPRNYARGLFFDLAPFTRNKDVVPNFLENDIDARKEAGMSAWLNLLD